MKRIMFVGSVLVVGATAAACCFGNQGSFDMDGPVTALTPGFSPDPMILRGSAGGPTDASTQNPMCRGFVGLLPSHTLQLASPMPLRILAHSDADTTLVVRLADGSYLCNDDTDGHDPVVEGSFPAGDHDVFVGTYSSGSSAPYALGLTVNPAILPSTMEAPQPVVGGPMGGPLGGPTGGGPAPGTVLQTGTATVALVTGNLPGVTAGSTCSYTQSAADPSSGFDCRWRVECNGVVVYGDGTGGYAPCHDPSWPPGVLVADTGTTGVDNDPSLVINPGGMSVRDDAQGPRGEYSITATLAGGVPIPPG